MLCLAMPLTALIDIFKDHCLGIFPACKYLGIPTYLD